MTDTVHNILAERGKRYGTFQGHAILSQSFKDVMAGGASFKQLKPTQREALEMICHKMARILNGDPDWVDSWRDVAGYAELVANELEGKLL